MTEGSSFSSSISIGSTGGAAGAGGGTLCFSEASSITGTGTCDGILFCFVAVSLRKSPVINGP